MSNFQRPPPDPEGFSPDAIWQRQNKKFSGQNKLRSIVGAKIIPDPNGGYHLVMPKTKPGSGSSGSAGWQWAAAGTGAHYDVTKSYNGAPPKGEIVMVWPTDPIVVTGVTDPDSGLLVSAVPGVYICIQSTGPLVNPAGLPAGTYNHIPQWPMPSKDYDITNKLNFWWLINEISAC